MSLNSGKLVQESRALIRLQWTSRTFRDTTRRLLKHLLSISFQQFLLLSRLSHLAYLIIYWRARKRIVAIRCKLATSVSQLWEGYLRPRTLVTSLNNMHEKYLGTLDFRCLCPWNCFYKSFEHERGGIEGPALRCSNTLSRFEFCGIQRRFFTAQQYENDSHKSSKCYFRVIELLFFGFLVRWWRNHGSHSVVDPRYLGWTAGHATAENSFSSREEKLKIYVIRFKICFNCAPFKSHAQAKMESRSPLRILLIGKGGRESALAFKLSQSPRVERIFVVPGNGGTAKGNEKVSNIGGISEEDFPSLVKLARGLQVNLVAPGERQILHWVWTFWLLSRSRCSNCEWCRGFLSFW